MNDIVAIIPARSGSKSVKDKNIISLAGFPVIAYSIAAAKLSKLISRVIVSTDSDEYARIVRKFGAETPFIRPKEISTDQSGDIDFFKHLINYFNEKEEYCPKYLVHLRPTTPIRSPTMIDNAINKILDYDDYTSLRSGHKAPESPLKWFKMREKNQFISVLGNSDKNEYSNLPKENFEDIYIPNGYVDIVKSNHIIKTDTLHGDKIFGFETPACIEIDSESELDYINYQINRDGSILKDFLSKHTSK